MRDLLSKVMTSSMVAGAALLVAACGGGEDATANNTSYATDDALMGDTNDVTAIDAGTTGADANLGLDANMSMDSNMSDVDMNATTTTDMNATNGM
ncbi:hypothetical protein [Sphingosinicella rhizophila]|uniref:Uncharacterized protein n=1 Tax=Sphingosinicella rhizophila TaxID=3050082 RepID=A0ABU3QA74_9SPHN|nr:hypothetical protein [Sphingosinicella sp. GR2756]MDT9599845.1 hypothetical protein [Sphingosinicella sp. GR2756]